MTKCGKHPCEQGAGVCPSCLRERLLAILAAQSGRSQRYCVGHPGRRPLPPLEFPRSVSPYASPRRSLDLDALPSDDDGDRCGRPQPIRFYSTPLVGPDAGGRKGFSIFSSIFGSGGQNFRSEGAEKPCRASWIAELGPNSWFAALLPGWRKKREEETRHPAADAAEEDGVRRTRRGRAWCPHRGMSPARDEGGSGSESGYSTESPEEWRRRPTPTPMRKPAPPTPAHRAVSGFVVCLSPLVRAIPRQSHGGDGAAGPLGERRGTVGTTHRRHRHRHGPAALCQNRSRKLADLGRFR
uniref:Putative transcription elongation factor SPT5 2 n=1 Tax=Anthurium amnicola TaxID=1678845 RepID=A0A1D1XDA1_9ARAE